MNPLYLNPYNLVGSLVRYFTGTPVPNPPQGGGNALLLIAYLMWTNSGSSSSRRRSRAKHCTCSQDKFADNEPSNEVIEIMDTDSEDEVKQHDPTPAPTPTSESAADLPNNGDEVQQDGGNRLRQRYNSPTPPRRAPRGRYSNTSDDSNINDLVNISPRRTSRQPRVAIEDANNSAPRYRRRNNKKTTPKRLQKTKLQPKKKADTEVRTIKGRREMKTLSQRFRHIRYCRCCGCEMFA